MYNIYLYIIYTYRNMENTVEISGKLHHSGLGMPSGTVTPSPLPVPGSDTERSRSDETLLAGDDHSKARIKVHNPNAQLLLV